MNRYSIYENKDQSNIHVGQKWFKKDKRFKNPNYMVMASKHRDNHWWVYLYNPYTGERIEGHGLISEYDLLEKYSHE